MKRKLVVFVLGIGLLAGCAVTEQEPDLEAARTSLLEVDRAWSRTVGDAAAFAGYFASEGKLMLPEDDLLTGPAAIQSTAEQMFSTPGFSLSWEADGAEVSDDASLGYTTGTFRIAVPGEEGAAAVERTGNYVTVWRRQQDGSWKVVVDTPTFNSPPPAPSQEQ